MSLFRRRRTYTVYNRRPADLLVWLEPWAEEFRVPPDAKAELILEGRFDPGDEAPFELTPTHLVFFAPGRSRVRVLIDGEPQASVSSDLEFPAAGKLSTRQLTGLLFGGFPEARLAGRPGGGDDEPAPDPASTGTSSIR